MSAAECIVLQCGSVACHYWRPISDLPPSQPSQHSSRVEVDTAVRSVAAGFSPSIANRALWGSRTMLIVLCCNACFSYRQALTQLNIEPLEIRRTTLTLRFAENARNHLKLQDLFKLHNVTQNLSEKKKIHELT